MASTGESSTQDTSSSSTTAKRANSDQGGPDVKRPRRGSNAADAPVGSDDVAMVLMTGRTAPRPGQSTNTTGNQTNGTATATAAADAQQAAATTYPRWQFDPFALDNPPLPDPPFTPRNIAFGPRVSPDNSHLTTTDDDNGDDGLNPSTSADESGSGNNASVQQNLPPQSTNQTTSAITSTDVAGSSSSGAQNASQATVPQGTKTTGNSSGNDNSASSSAPVQTLATNPVPASQQPNSAPKASTAAPSTGSAKATSSQSSSSVRNARSGIAQSRRPVRRPDYPAPQNNTSENSTADAGSCADASSNTTAGPVTDAGPTSTTQAAPPTGSGQDSNATKSLQNNDLASVAMPPTFQSLKFGGATTETTSGLSVPTSVAPTLQTGAQQTGNLAMPTSTNNSFALASSTKPAPQIGGQQAGNIVAPVANITTTPAAPATPIAPTSGQQTDNLAMPVFTSDIFGSNISAMPTPQTGAQHTGNIVAPSTSTTTAPTASATPTAQTGGQQTGTPAAAPSTNTTTASASSSATPSSLLGQTTNSTPMTVINTTPASGSGRVRERAPQRDWTPAQRREQFSTDYQITSLWDMLEMAIDEWSDLMVVPSVPAQQAANTTDLPFATILQLADADLAAAMWQSPAHAKYLFRIYLWNYLDKVWFSQLSTAWACEPTDPALAVPSPTAGIGAVVARLTVDNLGGVDMFNREMDPEERMAFLHWRKNTVDVVTTKIITQDYLNQALDQDARNIIMAHNLVLRPHHHDSPGWRRMNARISSIVGLASWLAVLMRRSDGVWRPFILRANSVTESNAAALHRDARKVLPRGASPPTIGRGSQVSVTVVPGLAKIRIATTDGGLTRTPQLEMVTQRRAKVLVGLNAADVLGQLGPGVGPVVVTGANS